MGHILLMTQVKPQNRTIDAGRLGRRDWTRFWIAGEYDGMECLHAGFTEHHYGLHAHDTYIFGCVLRGTEHYRYRGSETALTAGQACIIDPGTLHDGRPGKDGYVYRMMYPSEGLLRAVVQDMTEKKPATPHFERPVIDDPELTARIVRLHALLENGPPDRLARDSAMMDVFSLAIGRYGDVPPPPWREGRETGIVRRIRERIDDTIEDNPGLDDLAREAGMSRYRLLRCFRRETGMTLQAYRTMRRIARVKEMLRHGCRLAETAVSSGFHDQAHMTRVFRAATGMTPGTYIRALGS